MQATSHVLFEEIAAKHGKLGLITLNRPEALNALSIQMIIDISEKVYAWAIDANIAAVIIQSSSERAFCAGGDLKELYTDGRVSVDVDVECFRREYKLNAFIRNYPKPYIALVDGIAMGGGLGLSVHGGLVVAAANLKLAMPETGIGLYPDVGASYFLSRCPQHLGMYLGLTGNIIGVADAMLCGLAQAFVPRVRFNALIKELTVADLQVNPHAAVKRIIEKFSAIPDAGKLKPYIPVIESCFNQSSVEAVLAALERQNTSWAQIQAATMKTRSPTSLKITHKAIRRGGSMDITDCMEMEFNLTSALLHGHDVYEGIRAILVEKTHDAKWLPAALKNVSDQQVDEMFKIKCKL